MDSHPYTWNMVERVLERAAVLRQPDAAVAEEFGVSVTRFRQIANSENGAVSLRTRQRIQDYLCMTWAEANAGPEQEFTIRRPWFVTFQKRLNRLRGFICRAKEWLA